MSIKEGDFIKGIDPVDYSRAFESGTSVIDSIYKSLKRIEDTKLLETLSDSVGSLNNIMQEIKTGRGMLHSLIYQPEGKNLIENISKTSENLRKVTQDIIEGDSLLNTLIYDRDKEKILDNLSQAVEDLKLVTDKIAEGEGSIGAIINDPALYDNLIQILGGANRSLILRTMIRSSMKKADPGKVQ